MASMSLESLLSGFVSIPAVFDMLVHDLTLDSRAVRQGSVFCALAGKHADGLSYIDDAIHRGAVAILMEGETASWTELRGALLVRMPDLKTNLGCLADRFYGHPSSHLTVVGVTGTNGKTSVTRYLAQLFLLAGYTTGTLGTLGYGLLGEEVEASHTTPDVISVHRWLARMKAQGASVVVMEVSSHALDQGRVDGVQFRAGLFTNLTRDHLDYHETFDAYGEAKARLFTLPGLKHAVFNIDDAFGRELALRADGSMDVVRVSIAADEADLYVTDLQLDESGFAAVCAGRWGPLVLRSPLLGRFNVSNVLVAVATALALGLTPEQVVFGVSRLSAAPGRLQMFHLPGGVRVVVDYAHTPDALANALSALRPHCAGRLLCVFGCGGDRDSGKRPEMGRIAVALADHALITDDNPRSEVPEAIVQDILAGIEDPSMVRVCHDRPAAIRLAVTCSMDGDMVLVAGKGHEDYQEVAGKRHLYSDLLTVGSMMAGGQGA